MRTLVKKWLAIAAIMCGCLAFVGAPLSVNAADVAGESKTVGSAEASDVIETMVMQVEPRRGTYLQGGTCQLIDNGNCKVSLTGSTSAYEKVDFIEISLYLERYEGGDWVIVESDSNSARNSSHVSVSFSTTVTPGYNYRARAFHHILEGSLTETGESFTTSGTIEDN